MHTILYQLFSRPIIKKVEQPTFSLESIKYQREAKIMLEKYFCGLTFNTASICERVFHE